MSKALYPGTFDPITRGHVDIIERAARLFERVIVAVASNPKKTPLFDLEDRVILARSVIKSLNVSVMPYNGLTVTVAKDHGLDVIIRGARTSVDFEYEHQLATINRYLDSEIETVMLTSSPELSMVSSSAVRELAEYGCDVSAFVHPIVASQLIKNF